MNEQREESGDRINTFLNSISAIASSLCENVNNTIEQLITTNTNIVELQNLYPDHDIKKQGILNFIRNGFKTNDDIKYFENTHAGKKRNIKTPISHEDQRSSPTENSSNDTDSTYDPYETKYYKEEILNTGENTMDTSYDNDTYSDNDNNGYYYEVLSREYIKSQIQLEAAKQNREYVKAGFGIERTRDIDSFEL